MEESGGDIDQEERFLQIQREHSYSQDAVVAAQPDHADERDHAGQAGSQREERLQQMERTSPSRPWPADGVKTTCTVCQADLVPGELTRSELSALLPCPVLLVVNVTECSEGHSMGESAYYV